MVNIRSLRCSHDSCATRATFNVEGSKTAAYCRQHAGDNMVDVRNKRCSHDSCTRGPCFNFEGSKKGAFCSQHAETGMVDVRNKRCSHSSCAKRPAWGVGTDGTATSCSRHKSDLVGSPVINFEATCKVACCKNKTRWGLDGKQPTHCLYHGPLQDGLVRTVGRDRTKGFNPRGPSYRPVSGPSVRVKPECLF